MISFLFTLFLLNFSVVFALEAKMRNGPPTTFEAHRLPKVQYHAEKEHSVFMEAMATQVGNHLEWEHDLDSDSNKYLAFSVFSNHLGDLTMDLVDPKGQKVDLKKSFKKGKFPISDDGTIAFDSYDFVVQNPQIGVYKLTISSPATVELMSLMKAQKPFAAVSLVNDSPVSIVTHLNTYALEVGQKVGLVTRATNNVQWRSTDNVEPPLAMLGAIQHAEMVVINPQGVESEVAMHDDGKHNDVLAHDGIYGATFTPTQAGEYVWRAQIEGQYNGVAFQRSTQHLVRIAKNAVELSGTGLLGVRKNRIVVGIDVNVPQTKSRIHYQSKHSQAQIADELHTYAELWSTSGTPVAWAMSVTPIINGRVELSFDAKWLKRVGVIGSHTLELRNVYISEMTGFVPISQAKSIALTVSTPNYKTKVDALLTNMDQMPEIDLNMLHGPMPHWIGAALAQPKATSANDVILVHGYCSSANPFVGTGHSWAQAHEFQDFNQNLSNDKFAKKVDAFAKSLGLTEYHGIGHSQGGIALVHTASVYWTGLDVARLRSVNATNSRTRAAGNGRLIQSVGTPYKGCSGAGTGANLIALFGIACGANSDLTPNGADLWLPLVDETVAANTWYYTTVGTMKKSLFNTQCSFATGLVLEAPNDGTTELARTELPGANNAGNTVKQCHTTDMNFPVQTGDVQRNLQMDQFAQQ